jgi:hypothetical protein
MSSAAVSAGYPVLTDIEKILLQDMLSERAKLREAMHDLFKYAAIAVISVLTFSFNAPYAAGPKQPDLNQALFFANKMVVVSSLTMAVFAGFISLRLDLQKRLRSVTDRMNVLLSSSGHRLSDQDLLRSTNSLMWASAIGVLISFLLIGAYILQARQLQSIIVQVATKPSKPASVGSTAASGSRSPTR